MTSFIWIIKGPESGLVLFARLSGLARSVKADLVFIICFSGSHEMELRLSDVQSQTCNSSSPRKNGHITAWRFALGNKPDEIYGDSDAL